VVVAAAAVVAAIAVARSGGDSDTQPSQAGGKAFGWLRPGALPAAWSTLPLPNSPARLPLPPGWRATTTDPGTQTAILRGHSGEIAGYLNATPRQGKESLADWADFRVEHNRDEGDRDVRLLAHVTGFRFPSATGSCVLDAYRTSSGRRYREVACIVAGHSATTVIVAAAPPRLWDAEAPTIQRAITGFTT
jgi:hypothetical protein